MQCTDHRFNKHTRTQTNTAQLPWAALWAQGSEGGGTTGACGPPGEHPPRAADPAAETRQRHSRLVRGASSATNPTIWLSAWGRGERPVRGWQHLEATEWEVRQRWGRHQDRRWPKPWARKHWITSPIGH